jgi:hypothetical protein
MVGIFVHQFSWSKKVARVMNPFHPFCTCQFATIDHALHVDALYSEDEGRPPVLLPRWFQRCRNGGTASQSFACRAGISTDCWGLCHGIQQRLVRQFFHRRRHLLPPLPSKWRGTSETKVEWHLFYV